MIQTINIPALLSGFNLAEFLTENKQIPPHQFLLRYKGNKNKLIWYLAEQLKVYPKACHKLPHFCLNHCWYTAKSYEQSSSESAAKFKSSLFSGKNCLDLSGGLGVDDWAFAQTFGEVISLDPDEELNQLVTLNWQKLGVHNCTRLNTNAETFLPNCDTTFDLIYLDADRRSENNRSFLPGTSSPDYFALQPHLFARSGKILLKLSPYIDLHYLNAQLLCLTHIWVVSVQKEVKEILALVEPGNFTTVKVTAVEIDQHNNAAVFSGDPGEQAQTAFPESPSWFYEPGPSIIKAGLAAAYSNSLGLHQLHKNTAYYVSSGSTRPRSFTGRSFRIVAQLAFTKSTFARYLSENNIETANVSRRNFNLTVEAIRKAFKIRDGGDVYLFFATLQNGSKMFYHCVKED